MIMRRYFFGNPVTKGPECAMRQVPSSRSYTCQDSLQGLKDYEDPAVASRKAPEAPKVASLKDQEAPASCRPQAS